MKRSAPEGGYDFSSKRVYRRQVWKTLAEGVKDKPNAQVLLMPSSEGDEIDVCLSKGFREQNLHVVDRNAAIVAHMKRRYPRINTYGVELERAFDRIDPPIDVANLDLCGPVCGSLFELLSLSQEFEVWSEDAMVAVNMLRGREPEGLRQLHLGEISLGVFLSREDDWENLDPKDRTRLSVIDFAWGGLRVQEVMEKGLPNQINLLKRFGKYRSTAGHQTMLWSIWNLTSSTPETKAFMSRILHQRRAA